MEFEYHTYQADDWETIDDYIGGAKAIDYREHQFGVRLRAPWGELRWLRQDYDSTYQNQRLDAEALLPWQYVQVGFEDQSDLLRGQVNIERERFNVSLGSEWTQWRSRSNIWQRDLPFEDSDTWEAVRLTNLAVFGEITWSPQPEWIITAGLRHDNHSRIGGNTSPRLAVNYLPTPYDMLRLSVLSGYRLPNTIESEISDGYFISDDDLSAETIASVEFAYRKQLLENRGAMGLNIFYNRANNFVWFLPMEETTMAHNWNSWEIERATEIASGNDPRFDIMPGPFFNYTNLDNPHHTVGIEAEIDYRQAIGQHHRVRYWANTTYLYARYENDVLYHSDGFETTGLLERDGEPVHIFDFDRNLGRDINGPPDLKINLGIEWGWRQWYAQPAMRYVGSRRITSFAYSDLRGVFPDLDDVIVQTVPAYVSVDLALGYRWGARDNPDGYVTAGVMNLFNDAHHESFEAPATALRQNADSTYTSEIGRHWSIRGGWRF